MAENTSENLDMPLVKGLWSVLGDMAHHDNRDRKEDPVARQFPLTRAKKRDGVRKTYNNAGSLWIDCTIGSAMLAKSCRVEESHRSRRCCCPAIIKDLAVQQPLSIMPFISCKINEIPWHFSLRVASGILLAATI